MMLDVNLQTSIPADIYLFKVKEKNIEMISKVLKNSCKEDFFRKLSGLLCSYYSRTFIFISIFYFVDFEQVNAHWVTTDKNGLK